MRIRTSQDSISNSVYWTISLVILISICFKLLLIPTYHSTDFEVHRNWLALTHSLPLEKWYYENTSEWTLDYPPFFAYFEYGLSQVAKHVDPKMLVVNNLNYKSAETIYFQRISVIVTELLLVYAIIKYLSLLDKPNESGLLSKHVYLIVQFVFNFGLIIVDNVHFQYNGFLFGFMFLSVYLLQNKQWTLGAIVFSSLINFKHIYMYIAPAYFFYIFVYHCLQAESILSKMTRLIWIGVVTLIPFVLSFGPFIVKGQIDQLIARLFPFKRGLSHAYWAPNAWSLYNFADRVLGFVQKKASRNKATGGLVQDIDHDVLPSITPLITFVLSFIFMILPILILIFKNYNTCKKSPKTTNLLVTFIIVCAFSSFLFGWHVHEKAVLIILLPFSLLSIEDVSYARMYFIITTIGNYSLFPLIFTDMEYPIKLTLLLVTTVYNYASFKRQFNERFGLRIHELLFLSGILLVEIYNKILHHAFKLDLKYSYLPLMITSVYSSVGIIYIWILFLVKVCILDKTKLKSS